MSREDLKKGIEIQARVDAAKMDKVAEGLEAQTAVLKSIEEGQGELRDTMDIVLEDMSAAEAKALYGLDRRKLPCEMDVTERRVLCACVYTLMVSYGQNSEMQRLFYANLEKHLGVSERVLNFDQAALEQIDSHADRVVVLKVICAFLFLYDGTFGFKGNREDFGGLFDFCSERDFAAVCAELEQESNALGVYGIAERYLSVGYLEESDEDDAVISLPEPAEEVGYARLSEIVSSHVNSGIALGEPVELTETDMKCELADLPVWVAFDSLVAATKINNGYLIFTTYAMYLKEGGVLFGKYVRIPYESICYDRITTASGRKKGTRKLDIPYLDEEGVIRSVTVDDTAVTEEKLLDLILELGRERPTVSDTDIVTPLHLQSVEVKAAFLSLLIYALKAEGISLLDAYVMAQGWDMIDSWNELVDVIGDGDDYSAYADAFVDMIPYPSSRIVALTALEQIIGVISHNNLVEEREITQITLNAEGLARKLDKTNMNDEDFNVILKRSYRSVRELEPDEYLAIKERLTAEPVAYAESIISGVEKMLVSLQSRKDYKARMVREKADQAIYGAADAVAGAVGKALGAIGRKKK